MPRTCIACSHSEREAIDQALVSGEPLRNIAKRVSLSTAAKSRTGHPLSIASLIPELHQGSYLRSRRCKDKARRHKTGRRGRAQVTGAAVCGSATRRNSIMTQSKAEYAKCAIELGELSLVPKTSRRRTQNTNLVTHSIIVKSTSFLHVGVGKCAAIVIQQ
jgi:hypothetical protein